MFFFSNGHCVNESLFWLKSRNRYMDKWNWTVIFWLDSFGIVLTPEKSERTFDSNQSMFYRLRGRAATLWMLQSLVRRYRPKEKWPQKILFKRRSERRGRGHPDLHGGGGHGGDLHQGRDAARGHGRQDRPLRGRRHRRRCQDLQQHASGGECVTLANMWLFWLLSIE